MVINFPQKNKKYIKRPKINGFAKILTSFTYYEEKANPGFAPDPSSEIGNKTRL